MEEVEKLPKDTRLGSYKIDKMLGEGGMGFVYSATHEVLDRRTAIKLLRPEFANHPQVVTRFLQEAKAVNLIDHQNIISVYDYGDGADGSVYFVMEYLEGETLDDLMRKRRPMPLPLLLHTFGQIAKALAAAHAKQIVHRDLKPANIYVIAREDNPYFIKLLDFGIAQLRGEGAVKGLTQAGSIMGTPQYMSPEQISGGAVDHRSDVWAMGVMLYRAATGHAPFKGEGFAELAGKILQESPPPPREVDPMIPHELEKLIESCLDRNISNRCQSMTELIAQLERVKKQAKLTDEALLAAVREDAGAAAESAPGTIAEKTRKSIAGSMPEYQGVDQKVLEQARSGKLPVTRTPAKSKTGLYVGIGVAVVAIGVVAFVVLGGKKTEPTDDPKPVVTTPSGSAAPKMKNTILTAFEAKDEATVHAMAEAMLREAIDGPSLQQQGFAVDALGRTRASKGAALLYAALQKGPEVESKAARALADIKLPDAAPKLRQALAASGEKLKIDLGIALIRIGDKEAVVIVEHALTDGGLRLTAAAALAELDDPNVRAKAKPILAEIFEAMPAGRDQWSRAAQGLARLGDAKAKTALESELVQSEASRALVAAQMLAELGDAKAKDYLIRVAGDREFSQRGRASEMLARLGDAHALAWVTTDGLASTDGEDRKIAIAICAVLADATHRKEIAALASSDSDPSVRLTAAAALL